MMKTAILSCVLVLLNISCIQAFCIYNCNKSIMISDVKDFFADVLFGFLKTCFAMVEWMIFQRTYEALIAILVIIIVYFIIQGRHSKKEASNESSNSVTNASTTNVNLVNTVHVNKKQPNRSINDRLSDKNETEIKIPLLTENYNFQTWMAILMLNLRRRDKTEWIEVALANIDERVILKLSNVQRLVESPNGFEQLKNELEGIFNSSIKPFGKPKSLSDFRIFFERNQRSNESLENYASSIKTMLAEAFPKQPIEFFEDVLKERFIQGLNSVRLREKCREKIQKSKRLNEEISFDQMVNYAIEKFNCFDSTESDSVTEPIKTVRFETMEQPKGNNNWNNKYQNNFQTSRHKYETRYQSRLSLANKPIF